MIRDKSFERLPTEDSLGSSDGVTETPPQSPMSPLEDVSELPPHEAAPDYNKKFGSMSHTQMREYLKNNDISGAELIHLKQFADAREARTKKSILSKNNYKKLMAMPQMQAFKILDDAKSIFGSGVQIPEDMQDAFVRAMNVASPETIKQLETAITSRNAQSLAVPKEGLISSMADNGLKDDIKPVQQLIDSIGEQFSPETFNTQYRYEYLPRQWMSSEDKLNDGELMREHAALGMFEHYVSGLQPDDPRRISIEKMINDADSKGFKRSKDYNITQPNEVSPARLYGIKRTDTGFTSILGLAQGDRVALPKTDDMKWPHETNDAQNAVIMKILRQVEKSNPKDHESTFESAYKNYIETPISKIEKELEKNDLTDELRNKLKKELEELKKIGLKKDELKKALLQFSAARSKRIADQLTGIGVGVVS